MIIDLTDDEIELIKKAIISIGGDLLKDFIEYDVDNIDKLKKIYGFVKENRRGWETKQWTLILKSQGVGCLLEWRLNNE